MKCSKKCVFLASRALRVWRPGWGLPVEPLPELLLGEYRMTVTPRPRPGPGSPLKWPNAHWNLRLKPPSRRTSNVKRKRRRSWRNKSGERNGKSGQKFHCRGRERAVIKYQWRGDGIILQDMPRPLGLPKTQTQIQGQGQGQEKVG